jgi:glycosyltransferase involved in cell wall biosynthesis
VLEAYVRPWLVRFHIEHVAGPSSVDYGEDEVLLMSIVRNGGVHTRPFLEHHFRLGVRHIVLLDNGSSDGTVEVAREYDHVTVLRTRLPYHVYENTLKRYLAWRFSRKRWNLIVDIDERFDYPGSDVLHLRELMRYLNGHRYTAVVAQMLDLFPDCTLAELESVDHSSMEEAHVYYDTSNIRESEYVFGVLSNPHVRMHWDGIRNTLFGSVHGLTKAALVRVEEGADLFVHWHHVPRARIADFSAVLLHYPFAASFHAKVEDAVKTMRYGPFSVSDYGRFWQALRVRPETRFRQSTARRWRGVQALVEEGFLVVSPTYRHWLAQRHDSVAAEVGRE